MEKKDYKIHIIGAGISGLIAAQVLENQGYNPVILEASEDIGGRVKTHLFKGYQLDEGFQVLLQSYPMAKKYLDMEALKLQALLPGAQIYKSGKSHIIGDPTRDFGFLWSTITANVGSISDKVKIFKLNKHLKSKPLETIFSDEEVSTRSYLESFGFSKKIIDSFFRPFFSGIFLEPDLETSSRMFEFVYKMFGEGLAVLPKDGIGAIPNQLRGRLKRTEIKLNTKVKLVSDKEILLADERSLSTHFTLIACDPKTLIPNLNSQHMDWHSCTNLYFEVPRRTIDKPLIGLVADAESLINNVFYATSVDVKHKGGQELLSVTVVRSHDYNENDLVKAVQQELEIKCDIKDAKYLKSFKIPQALPKMMHLQNEINPEGTKIKPTIFLAGDYLLNGSLNAAMTSGERAAEGIITALEDGLIVENLSSEYIN